MKYCTIVPWHNQDQIDKFKDAWQRPFDNVLFQEDKDKEGCAVTKNKGIERALNDGAEVIIVLDDDCYGPDGMTMNEFAAETS